MWSVRAVLESVVRQGRRALHPRQPQRTHTHHKLSKSGSEKPGGGVRQRTDNGAGPSVSSSVVPVSPGSVVTRLVQGLVRKVSAPLWTEARHRATKRLVFGQNAPFFALVGVTLVSEPGLVTKEDELEALCLNIREAISRAGLLHSAEYWKKKREREDERQQDLQERGEKPSLSSSHSPSLSLSHFMLGPVIGKGCNAAVYAAKWAEDARDERQRSASPKDKDDAMKEETEEKIEEEESEEEIFEMASEYPGDISLLSDVSSDFSVTQSLENITGSSQRLGDITQTSQELGNITQTSQELGNITQTSQELGGITQTSQRFIETSQELGDITQTSQRFIETSQELGDITQASQELGNITHTSQRFIETSQELGDITQLSQGLRDITQTSHASSQSLEDLTRRLGDLRASDTPSTSPESREEQRRVRFRVTDGTRKDDDTNDTTRGAVSKTLLTSMHESESGRDSSLQEFPLAIKMMFNYEAESNAPAILKAMYKEITPAKCVQMDEEQLAWQERLCGKLTHLPAHPNLVEMPFVFVDRVPLLQDSMNLYPNALPARLNPRGYGRNMSLFCVMARYDMSLRDYLKEHRPSEHTALLLLTQLLEAVLHINTHNVAHRDLKSDNLLLCLSEGWEYPLLVVTDFGCSVASDSSTITVPFPSHHADPRQGNPALMAPEVITAVPGLLRSVNFTHSDIWAVGTLAYELYGQENPFCSGQGDGSRRKGKTLDSATYKESQLPRLPKSVPPTIRRLVHDLLRRNPRNRPSATVAATLCQLILWAPSKWLSRHALTLPTHTEIMQWLLCLTTKVLCEARLSNTKDAHGRKRENTSGMVNRGRQGGQLEYELVSTFLTRVKYSDIIQAIKWNRAF